MSSGPDILSQSGMPCTPERRPPEGEFFLTGFGLSLYPEGWGEVLCSMGSGVLFCEINAMGQVRKLVLPKESARWEFFATRAECMAAWENRKWRPK